MMLNPRVTHATSASASGAGSGHAPGDGWCRQLADEGEAALPCCSAGQPSAVAVAAQQATHPHTHKFPALPALAPLQTLTPVPPPPRNIFQPLNRLTSFQPVLNNSHHHHHHQFCSATPLTSLQRVLKQDVQQAAHACSTAAEGGGAAGCQAQLSREPCKPRTACSGTGISPYRWKHKGSGTHHASTGCSP